MKNVFCGLKSVLACCLIAGGIFEAEAKELLVRTLDAFTQEPLSGIVVEVTIWDDGQPHLNYTRTSDEQGQILLRRKSFDNVSCFVAGTPRHYCTSRIFRKSEDKEKRQEFVVPIALIGQPTMLKVREAKVEYPADTDVLQYDCLREDWLPPMGTGQVADVVLHRQLRTCPGLARNWKGELKIKRKRDVLKVMFPGEGNGIKEMQIEKACHLWVRNAPENGYASEHESFWEEDERLETISNMNSYKAYCFRIRTQMDESGSITNCWYGKIYGDINFTSDYDTPPYIRSVQFCYFLNETPCDRNLEHMANEDPNEHAIPMMRP